MNSIKEYVQAQDNKLGQYSRWEVGRDFLGHLQVGCLHSHGTIMRLHSRMCTCNLSVHKLSWTPTLAGRDGLAPAPCTRSPQTGRPPMSHTPELLELLPNTSKLVGESYWAVFNLLTRHRLKIWVRHWQVSHIVSETPTRTILFKLSSARWVVLVCFPWEASGTRIAQTANV